MDKYRDKSGKFTKGHRSLPTEMELKRAESMRAAWKKRDGYIGDLVNENPYIHNCWRAIRFTEKGKRAGCCEAWANFRTFYNDVAPSYERGKRLYRKDTQVEWNPDNFVWMTAEDWGLYVGNQVILEYDGKSMPLKLWADYANVSYSAIRDRYYKHKEYSVEEVIFGKKKKRFTKGAKDVTEWGNVRGKASKMISSYRVKDIKTGVPPCDISIEWMIENILTKECVYCGDTHRIGCDRIDNTKGHTKDNVVPCCIECNVARNNYFTYDEMRELGKAIAQIKEKRKNIITIK